MECQEICEDVATFGNLHPLMHGFIRGTIKVGVPSEYMRGKKTSTLFVQKEILQNEGNGRFRLWLWW